MKSISYLGKSFFKNTLYEIQDTRYKKRLSIILCLLLLIVGLPNSYALESREDCGGCFQRIHSEYLLNLRSVERHFVMYRWSEEQVRFLYYDAVWRARTSENDPLSKSKRKKGRRDESSLIEDVRRYEKTSNFHANAIEKLLKKLEAQEPFYACADQSAYRTCLKTRFQYFYDQIEIMRRLFDQIFENERSYRTEIEQTSGGPQGLYPQDALESRIAHEDYYNRFEISRHAARFQENEQMRRLFLHLNKTLRQRFVRTSCCFAGTREELSA